MTQFRGFETKEEAKKFQKEHGGLLCWNKRTVKTNKLTEIGIYYSYAVEAGLNANKYPYCVQWNAK